MRLHRTVVAVMATACIAIAAGCSALGIPSREEVTQAEAAYEAAEARVSDLERVIGELRAERSAAEQGAERIRAQRRQLSELQSRIALELAQAPDEMRPFIEQSFDAVRRQMRALDDQERAFAEVVAAWDLQLAQAQQRHASAGQSLQSVAAQLVEMQTRADEAGTRVEAAITQIGAMVGQYVPGAGVIAAQTGQGLGTLLGLGTAGLFGATTLRARKRLHEVEEQRDGAIEAMAITERFGIERIAGDPNVRKAARDAMRSNPKADKAFREAKAVA